MPSKTDWIALSVLALAALGSGAFSACGGSDICLGCDPTVEPTPNPENSVTIEGDVFTVIPDALLDDLVVLACTDRAPDTPALECGGRSTQPSTDGDFSISKVTHGSIEMFFYLQLETERLALLDDPDGKLHNVTSGDTADIQSVTVNLNTGVAEALRIEVGVTPTPTPAPEPTPED